MLTASRHRLRIAVAGTGVIGKTHIQLLLQHPDCELVALADPAPSASAMAEELGIKAFNDLFALLQEERLDGVILATPNALHVEQAIMCANAGVAALIEKPVAATLEQGRTLLDFTEQHPEARMLVGHHRIHSALLQKTHAVIQEGLLGELVAVQGSALYYKPDDYFSSASWRTEPGGGPILINMIHEIGNLRYLCGEISAVQAIQSNQRRHQQVEDTVAINLQFESGTLGTFLLSDCAASSASWEQSSGENPDYAHDPAQNCYQLSGTRGSLAVPTMRLQQFPAVEAGSWLTPLENQTLTFEAVDPMLEQLEHFCAVIRGEAEPRVSVRDGFQNLLVVEAIRMAAHEQRRVELVELS